MKMTATLSLGTLLLCCSCERSAIDPSESLVGAKALPPSSALSQEIIQINRGVGGRGYGDDFLSYELRPDNSLAVTHTFRPEDKVRASETFRLSAEVAEQARGALWRLRPNELQGVEQEIRPTGCDKIYDAGSEVAVAFISPDKRIAVVDVPYRRDCDARSAKIARTIVGEVLTSFPKSNVAAGFPRID